MKVRTKTGTTRIVIWTLTRALAETLVMVVVPATIALLAGLPLGALFARASRDRTFPVPALVGVLTAIVAFCEAVPFVLVFVALVPITRLLVGTSIGATAALVPISLFAIPYVIVLVEKSFRTPDPAPAIVLGMGTIVVALIEAALVAGALGGGGIGDIALRYGYERFDIPYVLALIAISAALVLAVRSGGTVLARRLAHRTVRPAQPLPLTVEPALQGAGQTRD